MKERVEKMFKDWPKVKKIIGVIFIVYGLIALITPFTPGSLLIFVGLELLGVELLFWDKIKTWFKSKRF